MGQPCNCDVAKSARVSALSQDGTEVIVTGLQQFPRRQRAFCGILWAGDDIPEEFLENAKRIGKEALKAGDLR
jgi:hypothetical protein